MLHPGEIIGDWMNQQPSREQQDPSAILEDLRLAIELVILKVLVKHMALPAVTNDNFRFRFDRGHVCD